MMTGALGVDVVKVLGVYGRGIAVELVDDFMGVVWSGGFTTESASCTVTSTNNFYAPPVLNLCASVPNAGRVWEFTETWSTIMIGQPITIYLTNIDINITLTKENMTGGGNTAEAVLKN
jgi:hypothetical protein